MCNRKIVFLTLSCAVFFFGCQRVGHIAPKITAPDATTYVSQLPSPFSSEENNQDVAKELFVGKRFAKEGDFYRSITSFKRAQFFLKDFSSPTEQEITYDILLSYWLARKYPDVTTTFEKSTLMNLPKDHPAYKQLLVLLYDSFLMQKDDAKTSQLFFALNTDAPEIAPKMTIYRELMQGTAVEKEHFPEHPSLEKMISEYKYEAKSIRKAELLNALLPGAGYFYTGQIESGITSFILNTLFIAATWELFSKNQKAAAVIAASFELGWYVGGIRGAGLSAKQYNDRLYSNKASQYMIEDKIFPIFYFSYGF